MFSLTFRNGCLVIHVWTEMALFVSYVIAVHYVCSAPAGSACGGGEGEGEKADCSTQFHQPAFQPQFDSFSLLSWQSIAIHKICTLSCLVNLTCKEYQNSCRSWICPWIDAKNAFTPFFLLLPWEFTSQTWFQTVWPLMHLLQKRFFGLSFAKKRLRAYMPP